MLDCSQNNTAVLPGEFCIVFLEAHDLGQFSCLPDNMDFKQPMKQKKSTEFLLMTHSASVAFYL